MKRILGFALLLAGLVLGSTNPLYAQASLAQTTIATAVPEVTGTGNPTTTIAVISVTCTNCRNGATIGAGDAIFVDYEYMLVRSVSSTNLTVTRGYQGTRPSGHLLAAQVFAGSPDDFFATDGIGNCTSTNQVISPRVNITNGHVQICDSTANQWRGVSYPQTYASGSIVGRTPVAGTANYTILSTDYLIGITTMTAARTFTMPAPTGLAGKTLIIVDESGAVSTSNTLTLSGLFQTSTTGITRNVAFASIRLYSNGTKWFEW